MTGICHIRERSEHKRIFHGSLLNPEYIFMGSLCKSRKISVRDIECVELFQPTMGAIRIFASGGFMGYWGVFRESDIGRYYVFFGKASDCFLVKMKIGDKYVLGCDNPQKIVDYIESQKSIMEVTR
ncbi:PH domain-containing protein [Paramuribaculum intestinale]|uniref:PH domain-containing protein n=1 Tax=Paramuribaculum intestinale TaxID=2094151 RepID=UPI00338FB1B3